MWGRPLLEFGEQARGIDECVGSSRVNQYFKSILVINCSTVAIVINFYSSISTQIDRRLITSIVLMTIWIRCDGSDVIM